MSTPRLADPSDVALYLRTQGTVAPGAPIDETLLERMLEAATARMIRQRPERTLIPDPADATDAAVERRFPASSVVQLPDLRELVSVQYDAQAPLTVDDYTLVKRPNEATYLWFKLRRWRQALAWGADELVITGLWGPAEPDPDVVEACIVWVARVFHQRTARFADNTATPDGGGLGYFRNLPPDVKATLDALRLPGA